MKASINSFTRDTKKFVAAATFASKYTDLVGCPRNGIGLLYFHVDKHSGSFDREANLQKVHDFMDSLRRPIGLSEGDPRFSFMRRMKLQKHVTRKVDNIHMLALMVKTWNYVLLEKEVLHLTWKRLGSGVHAREEFPTILVPGEE